MKLLLLSIMLLLCIQTVSAQEEFGDKFNKMMDEAREAVKENYMDPKLAALDDSGVTLLLDNCETWYETEVVSKYGLCDKALQEFNTICFAEPTHTYCTHTVWQSLRANTMLR